MMAESCRGGGFKLVRGGGQSEGASKLVRELLHNTLSMSSWLAMEVDLMDTSCQWDH